MIFTPCCYVFYVPFITTLLLLPMFILAVIVSIFYSIFFPVFGHLCTFFCIDNIHVVSA